MPFFFAMYGLFSNHFDLRGATFIPGWINDLSQPESIVNFGNFTIPILGWNDLRLLPIIFLATQLFSSKLTQAPGTTSNRQAKLMAYGLPTLFFFILYNLPAGLLVYWIISNILTAGQQFYINRYAHFKDKGDKGNKGKKGKKK
jgi:YidC/Oxa1 family membrane protein insertase